MVHTFSIGCCFGHGLSCRVAEPILTSLCSHMTFRCSHISQVFTHDSELYVGLKHAKALQYMYVLDLRMRRHRKKQDLL
jgi:hypothetical protein